MDGMMMDSRDKEAMNIADQIHNAARIMEDAMRIESAEGKKALSVAAKTLIDDAMARFDESIGASIADDDED